MASTAVRNTRGLNRRGDTPVYVTMAAIMLVVAIAAGFAQSVMTSAERNQLDGYMSTGLGLAHEAVASWINQQERMASTWADSDAVSTLTGALLEVTPTRDALLASASHTDLSGLLTTPVTAMKYLSYSVVNKDGLVISSNGPDEMGMTWGGEWARADLAELVGKAWVLDPHYKGRIITADHQTGTAMIHVVHTIATLDGDPAAALVFSVDPTMGLSDILRRGRFGESGETFAFDRVGHLLSDSRYEDQVEAIGLIDIGQSPILNVSLLDPGVNLLEGEDGAWPIEERPLTLLASEALAGRSGSNLDGFRDYRGVDVVGAWVWDEALGIGIGTKVDRDEAFSVASSITRSVVIFIVVIEVMILAAGVFVARSRRIQKSRISAASEYRSISAAATDAIITADATGTVRSWNPMAGSMLGFTAEEAIGMSVRTVIPEGFHDAHSDLLRRLAQGTQRPMSKPIKAFAKRRDGTEFPVALTINSWDGDDGRVHCLMLSDITERVRNDQERLHDRQQLKDLLDSKELLIAAVSHELRTPLTSIVAYADLLLHERDRHSPAEVEEMIRTVTAESDDLAGIVEDLLVAARTDLEAVPMSAERVDLGSIAKSTIDRMSAVPLGDTLPINGQADVKADPGRVRQILRNLVSNALRHGGDLIHIEIAVEGGTTTLSVRDGGDEIPQSAQDRIFEAYGTADKEHRHAHSIGLGLPVSRRLAELMGGTLTYRHQNGESIFELSLPEWVDSASTTEHRVLDHDAAAA